MSQTQTTKRAEPRIEIIEEFRRDYATALAAARVSEEHTATAGWRSLYHDFCKANREARRKQADWLKALAEMLESSHLSEDQEKEIGEVKKAVAELREQFEAFTVSTIDPVRAPVSECREVANNARSRAQILHDRAPLMNDGLIREVENAIQAQPKPTWEDKSGRVVITN